MQNIRFISEVMALALHQDQIKRYGGDAGIRDAGLLASALAMPQAMFGGHYVHEDLIAMAGAYLFHLAKNLLLLMAISGSRLRQPSISLMTTATRLISHTSRLSSLCCVLRLANCPKAKRQLFCANTRSRTDRQIFAY